MSRSIVGHCDNHPIEDKVLGDTHRVDLGNGPREFEACEDCWSTMTVPQLEKLVYEHGRDVSEGGDEKRKLRCPWCLMSLASLKTLRDHVQTKHAEKVGEFVSLFNRPSKGQAPGVQDLRRADEIMASAGVKRTRRTEPRQCEQCGQVCASPQGLGAHMRSAHGVEGTSPATLAKRRAAGSS